MAPILPNAGPPRPPTHKPIDPTTLFALRDALQKQAHDGTISYVQVETIAREKNVPRAHVIAAISFDPNLTLDIQSEVLLAVCTGGCQSQGAIDYVERLLQLREQRQANNQPNFDLVPRSCLDLCAHAPAAISRSPHGTAAHPRLDRAPLEEIIATLCDP